jgi:hypothetical protein
MNKAIPSEAGRAADRHQELAADVGVVAQDLDPTPGRFKSNGWRPTEVVKVRKRPLEAAATAGLGKELSFLVGSARELYPTLFCPSPSVPVREEGATSGRSPPARQTVKPTLSGHTGPPSDIRADYVTSTLRPGFS